MTQKQALKKVESMSREDFKSFFNKLPERTKFLVTTGFCEWKIVLPQWYIKLNCNKTPKKQLKSV